ncbi:MAG: ATP-binding protein [Actinomycetota bacterium]|nr:ATP-binding protein [Actinomycetota bacterium]
MRSSLGRRLAASLALTGIAAAALTALIINVAFRARFDDYVDSHQEHRQRHLRTALELVYERSGGWDRADLDRVAPLAAMAGAQVQLADSSGRVVWEPTFGHFEEALAKMGQETMGAGSLGPLRRVPIVVDGQTVGVMAVRLSQAVPQDDRVFQASVNRQMAVGGAVAGLVAFAIGLVLARRIMSPITEVTEAARELAQGERSQRVGSDGPGEVGELGRMFNAMAEGLEREDELRRAFVADIAHEVRTPLAILRSQAEALRDGVSAPTPAILASLHDETLRLGRLVADLETLASAEAARFSLRRQAVDFTALVAELAEDYAGRFEERGVRFHADLAEDVGVVGDATRLRQIVENLLSNALKFVPAGGAVTVSLAGLAGLAGQAGPERCAELQVADSGPGIPGDELPRVFDRFFRGRGAKVGGLGVGLAVVAELVRAHGGTTDASSQAGRGSVFTVRLPRVPTGARATATPSSTTTSDGADGPGDTP